MLQLYYVTTNVNTDIQLRTLNSQCGNCKQHPLIKVTITTKTFNFNPNFYITITYLCGVCVWPHVCTQRPEADFVLPHLFLSTSMFEHSPSESGDSLTTEL